MGLRCSETSFEETETDTSFVKVKEKSFSSYSFTQKLRPRGSRGEKSTATCKATYEAKKEERNKTQQRSAVSSSQQAVSNGQQRSAAVSTIAVVPKRGNLPKCVSVFKNETENIDPNGRSENVSMYM